MELELNQNVGLTGGRLFVNSNLQRYDVFGDNGRTQYISTPTRIGYYQPTIKYNALKWEKKINPLKYEEAKKNYIENVEQVNIRAVSNFFDLILAQKNLEIAKFNYSNTDTLYKIAQGRYNIGTIAENELLQMELSYLNAGLALNEANIDLEMRRYRLRSFLGYNDKVNITLIVPDSIPDLEIEVNKALEEAKKNHPDILNMQRQLIEAQRDVAETKAEKGLNADLFASYGLTQRADDFADAYKSPLDQQRLRLGIELPIVDWGLGRGQHKMAQSAQEVIRTNVLQQQIDFDQEIFLMAMQFNLQDDQVEIAKKAGDIAQSRYSVTKSRFLIGKIDVLDLNVAQTEKDEAQQKYISALRNYWDYYYSLRRLTLYDFINAKPLEQDFDELMN
jgi:outer membrane protein TolC